MSTTAGAGQGDAASESEASSSENEKAATETVVKDAMGHEVTVPANPQRILASYLEDHLVALGIQPVAQWSVGGGETVQEYLQEDLQGVPVIDYSLPPEAVAGFTPDFIIIGSESMVQKGLYEQYSKIAPTYVLGDELIDDWRDTLLKIGELLGQLEKAEQVIEEYDRKAEETKQTLQQLMDGETAAILWLIQKQFYVVDESQSSGEVLYEDLGVSSPNLVTDLPEAQATWNPVSLEKLAELDADHIFLINSDKTYGAEIMNSTIWKGLPAVKAGHVHEISSDSSWLYSGAVAGQMIMEDILEALEP